MFVIAGATGRVGSVAAQELLAQDADVRVLVRSELAALGCSSRGADARRVGLEDQAALSTALTGATGLFVLLPFDLTVDDLDAYADSLIASIVGAVAEAGVPHVVMLSSGGADLAEGTGPITGLHRLEQALFATGTTLTALRPGHFQEKVSDVLDVVRSAGVFPVFAASADEPLPMVATRDIGTAAARSLLDPPVAGEVVDVLGPQYSEREVAAVLGRVLGRELEVAVLPEEAWAPAFVDSGLEPHIAASLAQLYAADEKGLLAPRGDRTITGTTPIEVTISQMLGANAQATGPAATGPTAGGDHVRA